LTLGSKFGLLISALSKLVLKRPKLNDSLLISTFLSSSIDNLSRKGFPVERILSLKYTKPISPADNSKMLPSYPEGDVLTQKAPFIPNTGRESPKSTNAETFNLFKMIKNFTSTLTFPSFEYRTRNDDLNPNDKKILENQLRNSIKSCVNFNESKLKTVNHNFSNSNEQGFPYKTECAVIDEKNLILFKIVNKIPLYVDHEALDQGKIEIVEKKRGVDRFIFVLELLCDVFDLDKKAVHIFWDLEGSKIAFNRDRALFFNLRYYLGWHFENDLESRETFYYWFMVFCHELAHNFHGPHDLTHEHWLSSFAEKYLGRLFTVLNKNFD
jgi:hypothetical protein